MKYMLLIYADPDVTPPADETERYLAYSAELIEAGKMEGGAPLEGIDTATTVVVDNGKTVTTDGPFAETKEVLGGYYIIEAADLDEAIVWAAKIPTAEHGKVEVRPVRDFPGM